jgi:hypothetical protein
MNILGTLSHFVVHNKTTPCKAQNLLGCTAVFLIECRPTFQTSDPFALGSLIAVMMEAAHTSETSVDIQLRTRQYILEYSELYTRHRENLKSLNAIQGLHFFRFEIHLVLAEQH